MTDQSGRYKFICVKFTHFIRNEANNNEQKSQQQQQLGEQRAESEAM